MKLSRDDGAALLFVAMAMLLILGIAALVIDLGALRYDLRADRLASDLAATAGASALDPLDPASGPHEACEIAKDYALLNLGESSWDVEPNCAPIPTYCDEGTIPPPVSGDVGPYHVEIVYPVPDDSPLMSERSLDAPVDGPQCSRVGVSITRNRVSTFARILGVDEQSTEVRSVARYSTGGDEGEVVPLVILEPHECNALYTSGQGKVTVSYYQDLASGLSSPGLIVVDSDATACGPSNPYSIDSQGNLLGWIRALPVPGTPGTPSVIYSYALGPWGSPTNSYDPSDVSMIIPDPGDDSDAATWRRLFPQPSMSLSRLTRKVEDWTFNCNASYPDYDTGTGTSVEIQGCKDAASGTQSGVADGSTDYIDQLVAKYEGQPLNPVPTDFNVWTDPLLSTDPNYANYPSGFPCDLQGSDPAISVSGDWYVNCPGVTGGQGFTIRNSVTFADGDTVFAGQVRTVSGGDIRFNAGGADNHIVYLRDGNLIKDAQSSISLEHTMVYLTSGRIDFNGGDGGLVWTAPLVDKDKDPVTYTFQDHFKNLALWSESSEPHHIGGQAGNVLEGTFFTPYADPFELSGQGSQVQFEAQFITRKLELSGQAIVEMEPNPDRTIEQPLREIMLIR
jgi:hypothetical protein